MPAPDQNNYEQAIGAQAMQNAGLGKYAWIASLPKSAIEELLGLIKPTSYKTRATKAKDDAIADIENPDSYNSPFLH